MLGWPCRALSIATWPGFISAVGVVINRWFCMFDCVREMGHCGEVRRGRMRMGLRPAGRLPGSRGLRVGRLVVLRELMVCDDFATA